jgi:Fur family transcriptional regulator, ferric uptake regulator
MLESHGQRNTRQRQVVLETLRRLECHPTADELYRRVRRTLPRVSLGTIYRNLDILTRCGLVRRLDAAGGQARYDGDLSGHVHVRCIYCGGVDDISGPLDSSSPLPPVSRNGFQITGCRLEYIGICPVCMNKQRPEDRESAVDSTVRGPAQEEKDHVEEKD